MIDTDEARHAMREVLLRLGLDAPDKADWLAWFAEHGDPDKTPGVWNQALRLVNAVRAGIELPEAHDRRGWAAILEPGRDLDAVPARRR